MGLAPEISKAPVAEAGTIRSQNGGHRNETMLSVLASWTSLCFAKTTSGWETNLVYGFVGGCATNFRPEMADQMMGYRRNCSAWYPTSVAEAVHQPL